MPVDILSSGSIPIGKHSMPIAQNLDLPVKPPKKVSVEQRCIAKTGLRSAKPDMTHGKSEERQIHNYGGATLEGAMTCVSQ